MGMEIGTYWDVNVAFWRAVCVCIFDLGDCFLGLGEDLGG